MDTQVFDMQCEVVHVRFHKDIYAVCECRTSAEIPPEAMSGFNFSSNERSFIACGDGMCVQVGRKVLLSGHWEKNAKYNNTQLKITDCRDYVGSSKNEIVAYLSSNILKGIGEKTAVAIYERFGTDSVSVIETNPTALLEISGIKEKKLSKIISSYEKNRELHALARLLTPHNVPYRTVVRIHRHLGEGSAAKVRANPYVLCEVSYFGFKQADAIAMKMGGFGKSEFRIAGAVVYVLKEAQQSNGHLFMTREQVALACCSENILNNDKSDKTIIKPPQIYPVIDKLLAAETVCTMELAGDNLTPDAQRIYLRDAYVHEKVAAEAIAKLLNNAKQTRLDQTNDWARVVCEAERALGVSLDEKQRDGAIMALSSAFSIITGGPGTGKTTGLRVVVTAYETAYPGKPIVLAAPTGRAARRMAEQTGKDASTLHSLLGLKPDTVTDFNEAPLDEELVDAGLLVVDEASMIDAHLMAELMHRIQPGTQILLLGDSDQLPSVGPGNVLRQLLSCTTVPHTKLERIFRQADGSVIPQNAANIRRGINDLVRNKYFKVIHCSDEEEGAKAIVELQKRCMERGMIGSTQVLCPMKNRGATCTRNINAVLHDIVNPPSKEKQEVTIGTVLFRVGDKVMQTVNRVDASNGDIGFIQSIEGDESDKENLRILVKFDISEIPVEYDYEAAMDLEHALAITIHKSQGSEFGAVVVPIFRSMSFFLKRNVFYTAVTRAKTQVVLVSDEAGIDIAVKREDTSKRNTVLARAILDAQNTTNTKQRFLID